MMIGERLALEGHVAQAYKTLARDRARFGGTNYPVYKGQTIPPKSSLTQRAEDLRDRFASKPVPYSGKLNTVLNRNNQGISQDNIQQLLSNLGSDQRRFSQDTLLGELRKQFLNSYDSRASQFSNRTDKDFNRFAPQSSGQLQDIGRISSVLEGSRNQQIANTLQSLQSDKLARRQGLLANLDQFGNQKQGYNNMVNSANRAQFMQEVRDPHTRMQMLEQALEPHKDSVIHPDISAANKAELTQIMRAYNSQGSKYPGQLVAGLPPEIEASHDVLGKLNPSLKDNYTDRRNTLINNLVANNNLSSSALRNLSPAMQGQISQLEQQAKDRMRKDLGTLTGKYVRLGQYGSPQHMGAAEERARELNKSVLEQRDRILQDSLKDQLKLQHSNEITNISQLGQLGQQSHRDYGNLLKNIRDINATGATKFGNDQAENEELYKNYQNEKLWEWPHMRNNVRNDAFNEVFAGLGQRNISLDNLAALNTNYSNIEGERNRYRDELNTMQQARDSLQGQLDQRRQQFEMQQKQQAAEKQRLESLRTIKQPPAEQYVTLHGYNDRGESDSRHVPMSQTVEWNRLLSGSAGPGPHWTTWWGNPQNAMWTAPPKY